MNPWHFLLKTQPPHPLVKYLKIEILNLFEQSKSAYTNCSTKMTFFQYNCIISVVQNIMLKTSMQFCIIRWYC